MSDTYRHASAFLASIDEDWARHIAAIGPCLHQPKPARDPYEALVRAIAIAWSRTIRAHCGWTTKR